MKHKRLIVTLAAVFGGLLLAAVAIDVTVSSPRLCGSCHEISPRTHTWSQSAHNTVSCTKCHLPVRAWYALPQRVGDRVQLLRRDIGARLDGGYQDPVDKRSEGVAPVSDEHCLQCHDPNRKATSGFRILIDHPEHAKRNGSCVSCHVRTAHPIESRGKAMSLMSQCFTCHGVQASSKASGECDTCHPSGYALTPASHKPKNWSREHGEVSKEDPKQCTMCHKKAFCSDCHGLKMPHPVKWEQGKTGHGKVAGVNRGLCSRCHTGGPDLCTMCHHNGFEPAKGPWVKQHFTQVRHEGLGGCMKCHSPVFCTDCHVRWASES